MPRVTIGNITAIAKSEFRMFPQVFETVMLKIALSHAQSLLLPRIDLGGIKLAKVYLGVVSCHRQDNLVVSYSRKCVIILKISYLV